MAAVAVFYQQEHRLTVENNSIASGTFRGPYNMYNFLVNNANSVISSNGKVYPEAKKLIRVCPFGGGAGCCSYLTTLLFYAVLFGGISCLVFSVNTTLTPAERGTFIAVSFSMFLFHFVGFILMYINSCRFFGKPYFIKLGVRTKMEAYNHFLTISANQNTQVSMIAANDQAAIYARLQRHVGCTVDVMVYKCKYRWRHNTMPRIQYFIIIVIHGAATVIQIMNWAGAIDV